MKTIFLLLLMLLEKSKNQFAPESCMQILLMIYLGLRICIHANDSCSVFGCMFTCMQLLLEFLIMFIVAVAFYFPYFRCKSKIKTKNHRN